MSYDLETKKYLTGELFADFAKGDFGENKLADIFKSVWVEPKKPFTGAPPQIPPKKKKRKIAKTVSARPPNETSASIVMVLNRNLGILDRIPYDVWIDVIIPFIGIKEFLNNAVLANSIFYNLTISATFWTRMTEFYFVLPNPKPKRITIEGNREKFDENNYKHYRQIFIKTYNHLEKIIRYSQRPVIRHGYEWLEYYTKPDEVVILAKYLELKLRYEGTPESFYEIAIDIGTRMKNIFHPMKNAQVVELTKKVIDYKVFEFNYVLLARLPGKLVEELLMYAFHVGYRTDNLLSLVGSSTIKHVSPNNLVYLVSNDPFIGNIVPDDLFTNQLFDIVLNLSEEIFEAIPKDTPVYVMNTGNYEYRSVFDCIPFDRNKDVPTLKRMIDKYYKNFVAIFAHFEASRVYYNVPRGEYFEELGWLTNYFLRKYPRKVDEVFKFSGFKMYDVPIETVMFVLKKNPSALRHFVDEIKKDAVVVEWIIELLQKDPSAVKHFDKEIFYYSKVFDSINTMIEKDYTLLETYFKGIF
jgi:hypothetical protein